MIASFAHRGPQRFFEDDDGRRLPPDMLERIGILLAALDEAQIVEEMNRPSFRLHKLTGDRRGQWAITVRSNWRIVFRFEDGCAFDVDFLDYH